MAFIFVTVLTDFGYILAFVILAIVFVFIGLLTARILRPHKPTREKETTYECGEEPIGNSWIKFNIRFYVIALVFIIFDVEVVFLFPWAVVYQQMGMLAFVEMLIFLIILSIGFIYLWARGDLDWIRPKPVVPKLEGLVVKSETSSTSDGVKRETKQ